MKIQHPFSPLTMPWDWEILNAVEPDPSDEGDGGGSDPGSDGEPLGEAGVTALRTERERRKQLERQLANLETQLSTVKDLNPEAYKAAQERAAELERQLREREQLTAAERQRLESKAQEQVRKASDAAQREKERRIALEIKTAARSIFSAAEGRDGADNSGLSFFDAWMEFQGKRHLRIDEASGKLYVVDADGDRIKTDNGDIDPVAWLNAQADNSPVIGTFFKPKGGEGSGGFVGARGVRTTQVRSVEEARAKSGSSYLSEHYNT